MGDSGFSLIDLKGVSEPLTKLIDSVSKGIGAIYEPTGKVRNAKAEAQAMLILTEAKNQSSEISLRAYERLNFREIRRQENIDGIVNGAVKILPAEVSATRVDEDWIVNFFELCQDVGNSEMQQIWSKLLAGEIAKPGAFKPRTLQAVKYLTPEEARMFTLLCTFSFWVEDGGNIFPIFSNNYYEFIRANGISTEVEVHLQNIGLLSNVNFYCGTSDANDSVITLRYFSEEYLAFVESEGDEEDIFLNAFPFTEIGSELLSIAGATPNEKYIQYLIEHGNIKPKT